jgi:hypothetical protein
MASIKLRGDTSGELVIEAPAVAGTNTLTLPASTQTLATQNALGVRNLIINGDMRIAQRGTSVTGLTGTSYPTIDRYRAAVTNSSNFTMSQSTDVPDGQGLANSLKMECTTADASSGASTNVNIQHRIEAQNLQHLMYGTSSAKKLTLSFWVKSNKTGTYTIWIYQQDSDRQFCPTYTIDSADTWEKKTITIDGDTAGQIDNNNGDGLRFGFFLDAGTDYKSGTLASSWEANVTANRVSSSQVNVTDTVGNDWYLTGLQLEVGTEATPFEHRPYDMELQRCQRYYWKTFPTSVAPAQNTSSGNMLFAGIRADVLAGHDFTVEMRAAPTLISYNPYAANSSFRLYGGGDHTVIGITADTKRIMWISLGSPFTPPNGVHGHITASAEL